METHDLLHKMWLPGPHLKSRFKHEYNDNEEEIINKNLTFALPSGKKYKISNISLQISNAYIHYIEYDLIDKLPRQITNKFLGHTVVLTQLTDSTRQNINLFLPPSQNSTDLVLCFVRAADINRNLGKDIYTTCKSLPPNLKEMSLTRTNDLNSSSEIFANFHLQDLHLNKMNISWVNYINYLIDNEYLDTETANNFFSCPKSRLDKDNTEISTDNVGHSAASYFPISLSSYSEQTNLPMVSVQSAQIHYSSLNLNLLFDKIPKDLSKYYLCCIYYNYFSLTFNLSQNDIKLSPIVLNT